jgi:hypothetical protein
MDLADILPRRCFEDRPVSPCACENTQILLIGGETLAPCINLSNLVMLIALLE